MQAQGLGDRVRTAVADAMTVGRSTDGRDHDVHTIAGHLRAMAENPQTPPEGRERRASPLEPQVDENATAAPVGDHEGEASA